MARQSHHEFCIVITLRMVMVLAAVCMVCYILGLPLYWHLMRNVAGSRVSCAQCICDCDSEPIFSIPTGCGKHDHHDHPDINGEKENITDLLSEELNLLRNVSHDNMEHTNASILGARKTSSRYQKEAEKCNNGINICEEARQKAEATFMAELHLSKLWEKRARERGWKDQRKPHS